MNKTVLSIFACVVSLLFLLCSCMITRNDTTTEPQPGGNTSYSGGLTEKSYDPSNEESGDFNSFFNSNTYSFTLVERAPAQEKRTEKEKDEDTVEPTANSTEQLSVENNSDDDGDWDPWF